MASVANDFVLNIATVNGSGSQSANQVLLRTLFRMGVPVGGKNLFPSNIQGLPTWFTIRAHPEGFVSRRPEYDVVVTLNPATAIQDQRDLRAGGLFFYSTDCRLEAGQLRSDISAIPLPVRDLVAPLSNSVKAKRLLANMIYVGVLSEILGLNKETLSRTIDDQFRHKGDLVALNQRAIDVASEWARGQKSGWPIDIAAREIPHGNENFVLIDGNSAAAMGLVDGGATVAAWYPITPSSSLMESFIAYCKKWRTDDQGKMKAAIIQAEDELAAISMVLGAGWAGARAVTATSGPGLSLMAEAAGLAYFAEIPAVIWDVQRVGPSTGLPTRTMQGDVLAAAHLSHGDTRHVLLFPAHPGECFEFGQIAFDLAERLQTLVIVLSDLDLGMNLHRVPRWSTGRRPYDRGKVLNLADLEKLAEFARYADRDGDGIGARTLPGTNHPLAAYFTRGTGHDPQSRYSEDPAQFKANMDRLARKWQTAKKLVPGPVIEAPAKEGVGLIAYGSTDLVIPEIRAQLAARGLNTNYLRIRAFPFTDEITAFLERHDVVYVVEQNRDGQMRQLLIADYPHLASRLRSVLSYDGWPLAADDVTRNLLSMERGQ